jgi:hypothetical protein
MINTPNSHFADGDLVLARNGLNPQIRFAIGVIDGDDQKSVVQVRLLHVLRDWGNDGHCRPDERLVQAIHSGLGQYAQFKRGDAVKISREEYMVALQQPASALAARLFSTQERPSLIEKLATTVAATATRAKP